MKQFDSSTPFQLAEGTQILFKGRVGEVYRTNAAGCELVWEEYIDLDTGEIVSAISDRLTTQQISRALARGQMKLLSLPSHLCLQPPELSSATGPRPAELARANWRDCYISAAEEFIDDGSLKPFRADFARNYDKIADRGLAIEVERLRLTANSERAGQPASVKFPPKCGETIFRWWRKAKETVQVRGFDAYRDCGRRDGRFPTEVVEIMEQVVGLRLNEERPSIAGICRSVQARVRTENRKLASKGSSADDLPVPGYGSVWNMIARLAPIDHKTRTRGMTVAYRDLHTLGQGLRVDRVLQRVELDEYTVDLMVFLRLLKLDTLLTSGEKIALGLTGAAQRLILSAAIDVYSGAIVALQIAVAGSMNLTVKTIEMIYLDKQPIADAAGAVNAWPMHGHPQTLALDRAAVNLSNEMYLRLAAAGITNLAVPAGKPFLKPWIERFFATLGAKFLQQFTGRTFSNVVLKGENDPEKRATLTLDEFLQWLVRWIVDVHHTTKPETIGRSAPLYTWERAVAEIPPLVLNDESRLRKAFGDRHERIVSRKGVTMYGLQYIAPEISDWFLNEAERKLEVWWWHKRIGRVEVLLPNGQWVTAHCKDEQWADRSYDELAIFIARVDAEHTRGEEERDRYIVEADARTAELSGLRGLMPVPPSGAERAARSKEFSRHTFPVNSDLNQAKDLFDDIVTPSDGMAASPTDKASNSSKPPQKPDAGDIME